MGRTLVLVLALGCLLGARSALNDEITESEQICNNKQTCRDCIRTPNCLWCQDPKRGDKLRCFTQNSTLAESCKGNFTVTPEVKVEYSQNDALSQRDRNKANSNQKFVQIQPQRVQLHLRINEPYSLDVHYTRADDYPIDLYFLMDLSASMRDDKNKLSELGSKMAATMRKLTSDFRLGFGSFVDKTVMPYVSTIPEKLKKPCADCAAPYSFRNHMSLDKNDVVFSNNVRNAPISGNLDAPEGGLDALMQAIVCYKEIGWRDEARRLLVFATDADFHYAGDGKLGGIIEPNDGQCHLSADGYYTMANEQDYPSIGQINQKVKEKSMNIIFAVTKDNTALYENLSKVILGSTSATLSEDSSNVVQLVETEYEKISSSIQMTDNATNHVRITYYSACKNGTERQTSKCDGVQIGDQVIFRAEIVVTSCPENPKEWTQFIEIKPTDIKESLIVELKMLCECDCGRPEAAVTNSSECNNIGTYMCGICDCGETHIGKKCECDANTNWVENSESCRADNTTNVECNGRGICECGECKCESSRYGGKYCECDNLSCQRNNQLLCSGPDHGTCDCGQCQCKPEWKGRACECLKSKEPCMPPKGGEICSGRGECRCGECICESTEAGSYSGQHCEHCPTCSGRCQELKNCVQCLMYQTGPLKDICSQNCTTFKPKGVAQVTIDKNNKEQLCMFYDEDDCTFNFKYYEINDILFVEAKQERECHAKNIIWTIVFSVIGLTVLIGLATLLLWKLITTIHDRREYTRFEKERMKAKWQTGNNPLYKEATATFKNPTFANRK